MHLKPNYALFADFDETYVPADDAAVAGSGLDRFERVVGPAIRDGRMLFAVLSGSDIDWIVQRIERFGAVRPHVIASVLGTELHVLGDDGYVEHAAWAEHVGVDDIGDLAADIDRLRDRSMGRLRLQPDRLQRDRIRGYYLDHGDHHDDDRRLVEDTARRLKLKATVTPCNPAAGDPDNASDVAFMPKACGKREAAEFLMAYYGVPRERALGFGDSCNDLDMLSAVGHGFLVGSAHDAARRAWGDVLEMPYASGIVSGVISTGILTQLESSRGRGEGCGDGT